MKFFPWRQRHSRPKDWIMIYYVRSGEHGPSPKGNLTAVGEAQARLAAGIIRQHSGKDKVVVFSSDQMVGARAETAWKIASSLGVEVEEACFRHDFDDTDITPSLVDYLSKGINRFVLVEDGSLIGSLVKKYPWDRDSVAYSYPSEGSINAMRIRLTKPSRGGKVIDKYFVTE